jgi:hypothetical protein
MPLITNQSASFAASNSISSSNDIRGIKPPVEIPNEWVWAAWVLGFSLLALAIFLAWKRFRSKLFPPPPLVIVPPHVRAKQKLREALSLIHDPRLFCIAVSGALRVYLEERFDFKAPERTTEEFMLDLQKTTRLTASQKVSLADFLQQCDLVKFARFEPNEDELRSLHDAALRLIDETQYEQIQAPLPGMNSPATTLQPS